MCFWTNSCKFSIPFLWNSCILKEPLLFVQIWCLLFSEILHRVSNNESICMSGSIGTRQKIKRSSHTWRGNYRVGGSGNGKRLNLQRLLNYILPVGPAVSKNNLMHSAQYWIIYWLIRQQTTRLRSWPMYTYSLLFLRSHFLSHHAIYNI